MYDCDCLIHPFQNDPGTSQSERVMDDLLAGAAKIDARDLADLLDYFVQMSRHINFYDTQLSVSDWQPFFKKSIPFILASIIKIPSSEIEQNFSLYNSLFEKKPSSTGLQLHVYFIYYRFINKINNWYQAVKDSGLPIESFLETLIKDKLQQHLKSFIGYTNAAVKWYGIKKIDFSKLDAAVWNLQATDLYVIDNTFKQGTYSKFQQINNLFEKFKTLSLPFFDSTKLISAEAQKNLEPSLLPLKEELQKKHPPHLGLLFAFLNIFRQLQDDLNGYTRKHLDFFYKDVLQIKSRDAIADKTHIIFEIQKQLEKYLIKKGILVKDGKDKNKEEILFSLDDDIVVNKTEVAKTKTLFLNNETALEQTYVEGVYIANDATKADGIDKDFIDGQPKNFYTLGAKLSKYSDPETKIIKPYPNARLGFILASPVLYLKEGTRTVDITLACQLTNSICEDIGSQIIKASVDCCDDKAVGGNAADTTNQYPAFLSADTIFSEIQNKISKKYIYLSEDLFKIALSKGLGDDLIQKIRDQFLEAPKLFDPCYCNIPVYNTETSVPADDWNTFISPLATDPAIRKLIDEIFKPETVLNVVFSGEKDWLQPADCNITMSNLTSDTFTLTISATIKADQPSISFYDAEKLKEDFGTTQPLVKIELNDRLKFSHTILSKPQVIKDCCTQDESCCLLKKDNHPPQVISFYHFFRNVEVIKNIGTNNTRIDVQVCGLKNFIVQNDESLQDVNSAIYLFGTRPKVNANFYIGCKEIFCKKWKKMTVNFNWKDKPMDLKSYYHGYEDILLNINSDDFDEPRFKFLPSILNDGQWINNTARELFTTNLNSDCISYIFKIDSCTDLSSLFSADGWVKRICVKSEFINTDCIKDTCLNTDKTIKATCLTGDIINLNSFKPEFVKTLAGVDYIDYNCLTGAEFSYVFNYTDFPSYNPLNKSKEFFDNEVYSVNSKTGFIKITLLGQDFQHTRYPFILTRQMMALGKLPQVYIGPEYDGINVTGFAVLPELHFAELFSVLDRSYEFTTNLRYRLDYVIQKLRDAYNTSPHTIDATPGNDSTLDNDAYGTINQPDGSNANYPNIPNHINPKAPELDKYASDKLVNDLEDIFLKPLYDKLQQVKDVKVVIPSEPYTPQIQNMSLDYTASATIEDIDLIHLYPYAGTYSHEEIKLQPTLFPTFCDEGTLFLGLKNLVPGENVNLLFQLAEATSDSESEKQEVQWYYLDNNVWKLLRTGFEVLEDATENLTTSGIVKFALPANMTNDNTIMPKNLHWIKATIPQNSKAVSETSGIHSQAISVTFTNGTANDKLRLSQPLPAGSISKLNVADANLKSVQQPYETFGGQVPEIEQQYYVRVSEQLRHKGRAIQKFDYERLVLQEFPQLFKAKCINHSFALDAHLYKNDFPYSPGYVILAVIPDLNKLQAGNSFEPKVPVSILEKIETFIRKRTSPFVRFRAMNPRYEKINFCFRVNLLPGKDENYYKEQLKEDLKELLAPWAVGKYDKLTFGQCVYRSDIISFLENTDYVDFVTDFGMSKQTNSPNSSLAKVCPDTPRSILIAGDIEVCINKPDCDEWQLCYQDDNKKIKIDCCITEKIPVANYCNDKTIPID